ncbi:MAG TPA: G1 family glutamic endopeptidase [Thermoleophilaceae bacterium]
MNLRTAVGAAAVVTALCAGVTAQASASPLAHGHFVKIQKHRTKANANQSTNWFGYNQGTLEQGGKQFNSITGDWTVPTASQHTKDQDAYSSDWIGIGGGCVDANCTIGDSTLIQTGTEQDVDTAGNSSYSAWWELIPGPSIDISNFPVSPGDHMNAEIAETVAGANVWKITLKNVTKGQTFTTTVPYSSTHATAEWIEETPLLIGTSPGLAPLPNLTKTPFSAGTTNGKNAGLKASEEIQLIDSNGHVIGTPSAPSATLDGLNVCAWATSCS